MTKDSAGRPIPEARILFTHGATGQTRAVFSNPEGVFRSRDLTPGEYEVTAHRAGFEALRLAGMRLEPGQSLALEIVMKQAAGEARPDLQSARVLERNRDPQGLPALAGETARYRPLPRRPEAIGPPSLSSVKTGAPVSAPMEEPLGYAGKSSVRFRKETGSPPSVVEDRWLIGFPAWDRAAQGEAPYVKGRWYNPYKQNALKGDYPVLGQSVFVNLSASSESLLESRRLPLEAAAKGADDQLWVSENIILSLEMFRGDTVFKPRSWAFRVTPHIQLNHLSSPRSRSDARAGLQELFGEAKLLDAGPYFDFVALRAGIQPFVSDFRGFIYASEEPGIRLFGNFGSNRNQWNAAIFTLLKKDSASRVNSVFESGHQYVAIANFLRHDFISEGYTLHASLHYSDDHLGRSGAKDHGAGGSGMLAAAETRPAPSNIKVGYVGVAGDGHIGRVNLSHAFYQALGRQDFNPIARRAVRINAQMLAVESSYERDWLLFKGSFLFSSGDPDPFDRRAEGFDAILDNANFAGGSGFSFSNRPLVRDNLFQPNIPGGGFGLWNRQQIPLSGTGLALVRRQSLLPSVRSAGDRNQANFANPGLFLYNFGIEAALTPRLKGALNVNYLHFHHTRSLEVLLPRPSIHRSIGVDYSAGILYRPLLSGNFVVTAALAGLAPGAGLKGASGAGHLHSAFLGMRLMF